MNIRVQYRWPPDWQRVRPIKETNAALAQVIDQLHALASAPEVLRPPLTTALADLNTNLTRLRSAMTSSALAQRGIELNLAIAEPGLLDAKRRWRAELIVSELITNASRYAFVSQAAAFRSPLRPRPGRSFAASAMTARPLQP